MKTFNATSVMRKVNAICAPIYGVNNVIASIQYHGLSSCTGSQCVDVRITTFNKAGNDECVTLFSGSINNWASDFSANSKAFYASLNDAVNRIVEDIDSFTAECFDNESNKAA